MLEIGKLLFKYMSLKYSSAQSFVLVLAMPCLPKYYTKDRINIIYTVW